MGPAFHDKSMADEPSVRPGMTRTIGRLLSSSLPMRRLPIVAALVLVSALPALTSGQTSESARGLGDSLTAADLAARLDPFVTDQLTRRRIAGAVITIVRDDAVSFTRAYGFADVAAGRPMTTDTPMRIGSATKLITALAVMQLVEMGRLDLDREVSAELGFAVTHEGAPPVTLRRLLSHRTQFEDRRDGIAARSGAPLPLLPFVEEHVPPRLRQSAEIVAYSNYNATMAAALIARASGQPYEQYLTEHIFAPLGMTDTTAVQPLPPALQARAANAYPRIDVPSTFISSAAATIHEVGSTGVVTTGKDMERLLRALLAPEPGILSRASLDAMMMPQGRVPQGVIGLGLYSPLALGGNPFVGHDGGTGSFQTTVALEPRSRVGIFASYNSDGVAESGSGPSELLRELAARYFPASRETASGDASEWAGVYQPARRVDSNLFTLAALAGQLAIRSTADGGLRLAQAAIPFGGVALQPRGPAQFEGPGMDLGFGREGSTTVVQVGAPVLMYVRVPWWRSAGVVMPALTTSVVIAIVTIVAWPFAAVRHCRRGTPPLPATRLAFLLYLVAIVPAFWLVFRGWPLAALSSPALVPLTSLIALAAWTAIGVTLIAMNQVWRGTALTAASSWTCWKERVLTAVLVWLGVFCLMWRVAATPLAF